MSKRLYQVEAAYRYYVWAESEEAAESDDIAQDAVSDSHSLDQVVAAKADPRITLSGWGPQCLVYTDDGEELTLAQARARQEEEA